MEDTAKYRKYRSDNLQKARAIICLGLAVSIIFLNVMAYFSNQYINKKLLAFMTVISVVMMVAYCFIIERNLKGLKNENYPYEYVFTKAVMDQERKMMRENGEEVTYQLRTGKGRSFSDGHKIVLVYIPEGKQVYSETIENWKKIGMQ